MKRFNLTTQEWEVDPETKPLTALELLQRTYRDEGEKLPLRLRAAIEALPFEQPKLATVALAHLTGEEFASQLDRAIAASNKAKLIEAQATEVDESR